ncbi:hypothetical protein IJG72_05210 [bacterium]|nr:hypothetical protein [bacterium]
MSENQFDGFLNKNKDNLEYLNKNDRRMRFNNAPDPIYFVFNTIEDRPIKVLFTEFVKDIFKSILKIFKKK